MHIISGPTNERQPTFSWSNTTCENSSVGRYYHEGLPETWNFPWIDYKFQLLKVENESDEDDDDSDSHTWIIVVCCIAGALILILIIFFVTLEIKYNPLISGSGISSILTPLISYSKIFD